MPTFHLGAILTMCLVMVVVMIESLGMFLAVGEITGKKLTQRDISDGLRTDGLGTLIGGVFNTFPYTSFSQNVGLVGVTGVRSRFVCVVGGVHPDPLGLLPKLAFVVASVPMFVLGGAGIVMFGMVAATGIRILSGVNFTSNRNNLYIVAISIGFGMIPLVAKKFFLQMPKVLGPLLGSGILLTSISPVMLNLYFNTPEGLRPGLPRVGGAPARRAKPELPKRRSLPVIICRKSTIQTHWAREGRANSKEPTMKNLTLAALAIVALAALPVKAANWSDTYLGYQYSNQFRDPGVSGNEVKSRIELSGVYGWDYGTNFFDVNMLGASNKDPANDPDNFGRRAPTSPATPKSTASTAATSTSARSSRPTWASARCAKWTSPSASTSTPPTTSSPPTRSSWWPAPSSASTSPRASGTWASAAAASRTTTASSSTKWTSRPPA